jgi:hypothetical protein
MRKPDFFIVGAPRCGTTAMRTYLREHPEIFMVGRDGSFDGEPHFFGTDLYAPRYIRDEHQYLSLFAGANNEKRVGEKSTVYLRSRRAAAEIKAYQPSARIIIMLRNPIDMLYSLYTCHLNLGVEDIIDFGAALEAEKDRKRGERLPSNVSPAESWFLLYSEMASFTEQVQRYVDAFGWKRIHIIIFDDIIGDVARIYRETLRFLDVATDFQPNLVKVNPASGCRSRALLNFLNRPPPSLRSFVLATIPLPIRDRITKGIRSLNRAPVPPLDQELKRRLQAEFLPEVERLSTLLGRDVTHWCRSEVC